MDGTLQRYTYERNDINNVSLSILSSLVWRSNKIPDRTLTVLIMTKRNYEENKAMEMPGEHIQLHSESGTRRQALVVLGPWSSKEGSDSVSRLTNVTAIRYVRVILAERQTTFRSLGGDSFSPTWSDTPL